MNFSADMIDLIKKKYSEKTDSAVCSRVPKLLKQHIPAIRKGERHLTEEQALHIAHECDLSIEWVLVQLAEETAKTEEAKTAWHNLAKKISRSAYAAVLAVLLVFGGYADNGGNNARFA